MKARKFTQSPRIIIFSTSDHHQPLQIIIYLSHVDHYSAYNNYSVQKIHDITFAATEVVKSEHLMGVGSSNFVSIYHFYHGPVHFPPPKISVMRLHQREKRLSDIWWWRLEFDVLVGVLVGCFDGMCWWGALPPLGFHFWHPLWCCSLIARLDGFDGVHHHHRLEKNCPKATPRKSSIYQNRQRCRGPIRWPHHLSHRHVWTL
jgi:hypothetical protein